VNNVVILASTVVLMFALDWKLTIAALVVLPAFLLPTRRVGKATFQARKATQGKLAEMTAYMQETLGISGMQLVKAFVKQAAEAVSLSAARGAVEFEHVTFRYPSSDRPALKDVSFRIQPGQLAALVGPTGAGKTTVTSLLPRFYDPQLGAVRLDGLDVRDLTLESLGRQTGMVFQDTFLFHATIRENLLYA